MQNNQPAQIENRYALFIGVSKYIDKSYAALPNTVNDVTALDTLLAQAGYTTRLLHSDQAGPSDLFLIDPPSYNWWAAYEVSVSALGHE